MIEKIQKLLSGISLQRFILSRGVLVAFLVGIVFSPLCFAQDVTSSSVSSIGTLFQGIISSLSWLWIIFAVMAGKFMTNSVVYGSFLHLDQFFFHWWGLMRDIANFSLFGILLYQIIKAMISGAAAKFKNIIKNVLIAGVAIQASWFLTGALLDFSTVLVASFGTLPSQVISSNKSLQKDFSTTMQDLLKKKTTLYVDSMDTNNKYTKKDINEDEVKNMLDTITPTHNSLSGPLLYIGMSILDFSDIQGNQWSDMQFKDFLVKISIDGIVLILFSVGLFLFFLFNFLRVLVLWVVIPLSPIIILLSIMGVKPKTSNSTISSFLEFKSIIKLIFIPVVFVAYLSLTLLFLVRVKAMMTNTAIDQKRNNVHISQTFNGDQPAQSHISSEGIFSIDMSGAKYTFANIFLSIFTLVLLWKLVMIMFTMKTGFGLIDNTMSKLTNLGNKALGTMGVIPIPGVGNVGVNTVGRALNTLSQQGPAILNKVNRQSRQRVDSFFGNESNEQIAKKLADRKDYTQFAQSDAVHQVLQEQINELKSKNTNPIGVWNVSIIKYLLESADINPPSNKSEYNETTFKDSSGLKKVLYTLGFNTSTGEYPKKK